MEGVMVERAELPPTELNTAVTGYGLEVSKDKLTVRYTADGRHSNDVGAIQANVPVPLRTAVFYFEMTVLDQGEQTKIAIGFSDRNFKLTRQPGWEPGSYGFHGDDGLKYSGSGKGEEYGSPWQTGDTVGACYHLGRQEIFFTKNGQRLRTAFRGVKGALYPTVGLHSKNECVELNFGQQPFRFDLEGMIAEEQEAAAAAVSAVPLCHGAVHRLVRQYLVHYAYADTLAAFDAAAGLGGSDDDADGGGSAGGAKAGSGAALAAAAATATLQLRHSVRKRVMAGDVEAAVQLIEAQCPELLQQQQPQASSGPRPSGSSMDVDLDVGGAGSPPAQEAATSGSGSSSSSNPYDEVGFHVNCQRYVELLRRGEVDAAVRFAQATLAPYRERLPHLEPVLRDVVALVAYAQPAESPLAHLLSASQREFVADAANAALLAEARRKASAAAAPATGGATASTSAAGRSALERALAQLATVHGVLHEQNGSQGAPFRLSDHLLLPAQPDGAGGAAAPSQPMMVDP